MATTTTTAAAVPVTPVITNATSTSIADPTGAAPWSVATISTSTVTNPTTGATANVESVFFYLRPTATSVYGGAIQADYVVGANGGLTVADQVFYQPTGAFTATYYGSEAANPFFLATGSPAADPGFAYTQYTYAAGGTLTQVVATDIYGKTYVGV